MLIFLKNHKKYIWWMVTVGLFGIAGLLLVPIVNYAIKLANRYPKIFEWIFIIVCAFGVLFIEDRNTSFVILCLVVAITSNKLSTDSRGGGTGGVEVSEILKEARTKKGMTQQELADCVYVTRQTISKWELGKSVPDEASLRLLYKCLDIDNNDKKEIKKLATDRQTIFMIVLALVFSPVVIGIRYCLFKLEKFKKIKILIESIGFVLFALYLRALKDMVAYMLIFLIFISYLSYRYYLLSLERGNDEKE